MKGDYPEIRQKKTQQDLINEGKKFKYSVLKKPWLGGTTYQEMEYEATPIGRGADMTPLAKFPKLKGFDDVPILNSHKVIKHPCTCGGTCTGSLEEIEEMWRQIAREIDEGKLKPDAASVNNRVKEITRNDFNTVLVGLSDSYTCSGTGIEQLGRFLICGGNEMFGNIASSIGSDYLTFELFYVPSFPDESRCTSIQRCKCGFIVLNIDCGKGFVNCDEPRDVFVTVCAGTKPVKIYPAPGGSGTCSTLTIVNEDGSPATDTILKGGSLDFKTTGDCCGNIVWSASGTGASITQDGVLSASGSACGSLLVTATCVECGTSASQYVRVTDGGQWVVIESCTSTGSACGIATCTLITGKNKYVVTYHPGSLPNFPCLPEGTDSCCTYPQCPSYGCTLAPPLLGCCVRASSMYEWQCV